AARGDERAVCDVDVPAPARPGACVRAAADQAAGVSRRRAAAGRRVPHVAPGERARLREHGAPVPRPGSGGAIMKESRFDPEYAVLDMVVKAGDPWMGVIAEGQVLRIVDLEGNQAVDTLFYSAADPRERYSASDTIRMQGSLYLTTGSVLRSNAGAAMLTI